MGREVLETRIDDHRVGPGTASVWAGEETGGDGTPTVTPVVRGVTFGYDDLESWTDAALGHRSGHIYSRNTNPTVAVFEEKLRILEGGEAATSFSTGMAAISGTLFSLLSPGERVVSIRDTYGGTNKLFNEWLPRFGIEAVLCETTDHDELEREIALGATVVYLESPTNPTLKVMDIARLAAAGHAAGATVVVDNTFASPLNQRPLELGADLVLHSATKFLGGHSDALGGIACGSRDLIRRLFEFREINGATLDADSAYMIIRGMKTLELRVERQNANAQAIAEFLQGHAGVEAVYYPGLSSDPGHEIARRQMAGFGGVLSFDLSGGLGAVGRFLARLRFAHRAASLGSVGTLVGPPATTSHVELTIEERKAAGIPEGLIRYSVGIENVEDLIVDLGEALSA
jgi:cystathionine gamma-synthase